MNLIRQNLIKPNKTKKKPKKPARVGFLKMPGFLPTLLFIFFLFIHHTKGTCWSGHYPQTTPLTQTEELFCRGIGTQIQLHATPISPGTLIFYLYVHVQCCQMLSTC
jgi:hypothetical protein